MPTALKTVSRTRLSKDCEGIGRLMISLNYVARFIHRRRQAIRSRGRRLKPTQRTLPVLVHLRKGKKFTQLAAEFGISEATAWRYVEDDHRMAASPLAQAHDGAAQGRRT